MMTWLERNPVRPPTRRTAAAYRVAARGDSFRRMGPYLLYPWSLHGFERDEMTSQEVAHIGGADRLAPVVALAALAPEGAQARQLTCRLDPFGDHGQIEGVGERDHRLDDRGVPRRSVHLGHERLVDLQDVHGEALEVGQRGVAGAGVVDGKLDPELGQQADLPADLGSVGEEDAFGDLEAEQ